MPETEFTEIEAVKVEIHAIARWCDDHDNDVDGDSFRMACSGAASKAARALNVRVPTALRPGLPTLDFACAVLNMSIPASMVHSRLPGAADFRRALGE